MRDGFGSSAIRDEDSAGADDRYPIRSLVGRAMAVGAAGAVVTAGTFFGAGTAQAAESAVVEKCSGTTDSTEFGQSIVATPGTLDEKVEQAVLVVFPLRFDLAEQAREEFAGTGSIDLGTVTEQTQEFSGEELADEFGSQIEGLSAVGDKGPEVAAQVRNLAALSCLGGAKVPGQEKPAPPPPPPPEPSPTEEPAPPSTTEPSPPTSEESSSAVVVPDTSSSPDYGAGAPVVVVPPSYGSASPGTLPPWAKTQFGAAPGFSPNVGNLLEQSAAAQRQQAEQQRKQAEEREVRAAGRAETLPAGQDNRVALPVLIAAISLAGVTAALVRSWVLRRS